MRNSNFGDWAVACAEAYLTVVYENRTSEAVREAIEDPLEQTEILYELWECAEDFRVRIDTEDEERWWQALRTVAVPIVNRGVRRPDLNTRRNP